MTVVHIISSIIQIWSNIISIRVHNYFLFAIIINHVTIILAKASSSQFELLQNSEYLKVSHYPGNSTHQSIF